MQLTPLGIFISDTVKKLKESKIKTILISTFCFLADAKSCEKKTYVCVFDILCKSFLEKLQLTNLRHYLHMVMQKS